MNKKYIIIYNEKDNNNWSDIGIGTEDHYPSEYEYKRKDTVAIFDKIIRMEDPNILTDKHHWVDLLIELNRKQLIDLLLKDKNKDKIRLYLNKKIYPWNKLKVVAHNQGEDYEFKDTQLYT